MFYLSMKFNFLGFGTWFSIDDISQKLKFCFHDDFSSLTLLLCLSVGIRNSNFKRFPFISLFDVYLKMYVYSRLKRSFKRIFFCPFLLQVYDYVT